MLWENPNDPNTEPVELGGRSSAVWTIAFSREGSRLAAAGADSTIEVWNIRTRSLERTISLGRTVRVRTLAFSPLDQTLAAGTEDGLIHLLEANGGATSWNADQGRIQASAD